jgi:hypothetical protein
MSTSINTPIILPNHIINKIIFATNTPILSYYSLLTKYKKRNLETDTRYDCDGKNVSSVNYTLQYLLSQQCIHEIINKTWLKYIVKIQNHHILKELLKPTITHSNIIQCLDKFTNELDRLTTKIRAILHNDSNSNSNSNSASSNLQLNQQTLLRKLDINLKDNFIKVIELLNTKFPLLFIPDFVMNILIIAFSKILNQHQSSLFSNLNDFIYLYDTDANKIFKWGYKFIPLFTKYLGMGYCIVFGYALDTCEYYTFLGGGSDANECEYNYNRTVQFLKHNNDDKQKWIKGNNNIIFTENTNVFCDKNTSKNKMYENIFKMLMNFNDDTIFATPDYLINVNY